MTLAFLLWSFEFWWIEDTISEEDGHWSSLNQHMSNKVFEVCCIGTQHRKSFPRRKTWRTRAPLELVHSDIYGPITSESNGRKRIFYFFY